MFLGKYKKDLQRGLMTYTEFIALCVYDFFRDACTLDELIQTIGITHFIAFCQATESDTE